jgi:hypothetical protein
VCLGGGEPLACGRECLRGARVGIIANEGSRVPPRHRGVHNYKVALGDHLVYVPAQFGVGVAQPPRS